MWKPRIVRRNSIISVVVALLSAGLSAQSAEAVNLAQFQALYNKNINGQFVMTGNTVVSCSSQLGTNQANCDLARRLAPGRVNYNNNAYVMRNIQSSHPMVGVMPFNSSSASIRIPAGAIIQKAYFFWFGTLEGGSANAPNYIVAAQNGLLRGQALFSGIDQDCSSNKCLITRDGIGEEKDNSQRVKYYSAYADVASTVVNPSNWHDGGNAEQVATFTAGNIQTSQGVDRSAGWSLIVVYAHSSEPLRNVTVFAGFSLVAQNSSEDIELSDFVTPPSGKVSSTVGIVAVEGDASSGGDSVTLKSGDLATTLANSLNPPNNFMNSTVSQDDERNSYFDNCPSDTCEPDHFKNTFGVDIDRIETINAIPNDETTATVTFTSNLDTYFLSAMGIATELYAPNVELTKYISNMSASDGLTPATTVAKDDVIEYTIDGTNTGFGQAGNVTLQDDLPEYVDFLDAKAYLNGSLVPSACAVQSSTVTCGSFTLNPTSGAVAADDLRVVIRGTVADSSIGGASPPVTFSNVSEAVYTYATIPGDFETFSNTVTAEYSVLPTDLEVQVEFGDAFVQAGDQTTVTAVVTNLGAGKETNPTLVVTLPAGFSSVWNLGDVTNCVVADPVLTCHGDQWGINGANPLLPGDSISVTFAVLTGLAGNRHEVMAQVSANPDGDGDPDLDNNVATDVIETNHAPSASDVVVTAKQRGPKKFFDVGSRISDPDSDSLHISFDHPDVKFGQLTLLGTRFSYTPPKSWHGTFTVDYQVEDGKGGLAQATITFKVARATSKVPVPSKCVITMPRGC